MLSTGAPNPLEFLHSCKVALKAKQACSQQMRCRMGTVLASFILL